MSWEALTETASRHSRTFGYTETWPSQVEGASLSYGLTCTNRLGDARADRV
jgi:hypothetical protein